MTLNKGLVEIKDGLQISMTDLALLLKSSRSEVYLWLHTLPPPIILERIGELLILTNKVKQAGLIRLDRLIHRILPDGESLFQKIQLNKNIEYALKQLKVISDKELGTRITWKGTGTNLTSITELDSLYIFLE
jgi:hypothetical protein